MELNENTKKKELYKESTNIYYEIETVKSYKNNPNQIKFKKHYKFKADDSVVVLFENDFYKLIDNQNIDPIPPDIEKLKAENEKLLKQNKELKAEYSQKLETLTDLLNKNDKELLITENDLKLYESIISDVPLLVENILNSFITEISENVTAINNEQFKNLSVLNKLRNKSINAPLITDKSKYISNQLNYLDNELKAKERKLLK